MYQDYKDLLSAFHVCGVKYLIVGGYAVSFHSQPRFTRTSTFSSKQTSLMRMRRLPASALRSRALARKTSQTVVVSFVLDMIRKASIFFPTFPASTLTQHGNGVLRVQLTPKPG